MAMQQPTTRPQHHNKLSQRQHKTPKTSIPTIQPPLQQTRPLRKRNPINQRQQIQSHKL